jgi:hypothetical protein
MRSKSSRNPSVKASQNAPRSEDDITVQTARADCAGVLSKVVPIRAGDTAMMSHNYF